MKIILLEGSADKENTYFKFKVFSRPSSIFVLGKYNSFIENNNSSPKIAIHVATVSLNPPKR